MTAAVARPNSLTIDHAAMATELMYRTDWPREDADLISLHRGFLDFVGQPHEQFRLGLQHPRQAPVRRPEVPAARLA
jgi:hypothetical protein